MIESTEIICPVCGKKEVYRITTATGIEVVECKSCLWQPSEIPIDPEISI